MVLSGAVPGGAGEPLDADGDRHGQQGRAARADDAVQDDHGGHVVDLREAAQYVGEPIQDGIDQQQDRAGFVQLGSPSLGPHVLGLVVKVGQW